MTMDKNSLGPAERIINTLLAHQDHMVHNRPGYVVKAPGTATGVAWHPVKHKVEEGLKVVYRMDKVGKKTRLARLGVMQANNDIVENGRIVGQYRDAGLFPEVASWMYRQVAEVWKLDNEFCARWASYAFGQEHRDLKVVLAAFMLVQSRKGEPVREAGKVAFYDEDYRDVGEAMLLQTRKDGKDFNPKLVVRVQELLRLPEITAINRELLFAKSTRNPFYGRYDTAVTKWLSYREENPKMLEGLVKAGLRGTVMKIAKRVHYKPTSSKFFEVLRWKQDQAEDGRRSIAIGQAVTKAESWEGLKEKEICQRIAKERPNFKRMVGLLPKGQGLTRAIVAAAIESGGCSNKDLIILTPTLEELGLLEVQDIKERWEKAIATADDMRAANIATRVKNKDTQEKLQEASDSAVKKAVEEVTKLLRVYVIVDTSGSMESSIAAAKVYLAKLLPGFSLDRLHVAVFNTVGKVINIKHASSAGVENAFRGIKASGGTLHGQGVLALGGFKPQPDEDTIMIFFGDEGEASTFTQSVRNSGLNPLAFGLVKVGGTRDSSVRDTAAELGIPCFGIQEDTFADPYAIPRTIRNLIAATPVSKTRAPGAFGAAVKPRETLIDVIIKTDLLTKPVWAT